MRNILNLFVLIFSFSVYSQELVFKNLFDTTMNPSVACYRIPAIVTTTNGVLIAAIDERNISCGDLRSNRDINIVIRKSYDNGESWSVIEKIVDYPLGESASDPSLIVDNVTDEIFMFYNYMDLDKAKDVYKFMLIKSSDDGKSWTSPREITTEIIKDGWEKDFMFITSGRGTQTKDGTLLHCLVNLNKGTHVFGSIDHGESWFLVDFPLKPGDESKIVELSNGDWLVNSRVNSKGYRYSHISNDKGLSWSSFKNKELLDPGCNAGLINYPLNYKNRNALLFSNAFSSKDRVNLSLSVSFDQGKNWEKSKTGLNSPKYSLEALW